VTPFLLISLLVLVLVFFTPALAVWLPGLIG
jgi:TRAP-type C4-dicarboxylate transport system permease large subunit